MPKSGRNIPFHKEMTVPGKSITTYWHKHQEPPVKQHRINKQYNTHECASKVPASCRWFRVLIHIKGPKVLQAPEIHLFEINKKYPQSRKLIA